MTTLHVTNAKIWTGDPARPFASTLTIEDGRVTAIDAPHAGEPILDCAGDFVTPGLIDAHMHLALGGETLSQTDLSHATSREEFEARLAADHRTLPPEQWLIANGWSEGAIGETPDQSWLQVCGDRPTVCWRMDLHAALVNQAVLDRLDLPDDATIAEVGGRIGRDADGRPSGELVEQAAWLHLIPAIPEASVESRRNALLAATRHCLKLGLTTVRTMEYREVLQDVIEPVRDRMRLRCAIVLLDRTLPLDLGWLDAFQGDDQLQIIGCKSFLDGTIGSRTARMHDPWVDRPDDRGELVELAREERLHDWQDHVHAKGLDTAVHAIGDEAVTIALDLHDAASGETRCVIEHAELVRDEDLARTAGALLSMQPLHRAADAGDALLGLGPDRIGMLAPLRRLQEVGADFAFGSDWPVVDCDPRPGLKAAITGEDLQGEPILPDESISPEAALLGWTSGAALACRRRDIGQLKPQSFGDLVRWSDDLLRLDWSKNTPRVLTTVLGGKVVYDVERGIEP
jgi:predicted amidohydrolase YtcJ